MSPPDKAGHSLLYVELRLMRSDLRQRIELKLRGRTQRILDDSSGGLPPDFSGPLYLHLDQVIEVVGSIRDYSTDPYLQRVREVVCPE